MSTVSFVKPGAVVVVPTMDELARMVERELIAAARRQYRALSTAKKQATDDVISLTAQRKAESDRLAAKLKDLKSLKDLLTKQGNCSGTVWAALDAVHDQYLVESAANDDTLRMIDDAKARRKKAILDMLALRATPGWEAHRFQRAAKLARERDAEAAAAAIESAACPAPDDALFEQVAEALAQEPEPIAEIPEPEPEPVVTRTARRKANKAPKAEKEPEEEVCHVKPRSARRNSRAATIEEMGLNGMTAAQISRAMRQAENA